MKAKHICQDFSDFISNFDIIGFQETKLTKFDNVELENFELYTKNRESKSRVASGGIALAVKKSFLNHITIINTDSSLVLWFRLSKNLTHFDSDTLCGVTYIPPEYTKYSVTEPFTEIQGELDKLIGDFDSCLIFGDFNARTGTQNEFIDADEYLLKELNLEVLEGEYNADYAMFENNNIDISRTVSDKISNNYGYKLINFCKRNNMFILNGRFGEDKLHGHTTCRNSSCIDYFISNVLMFEHLCNLYVDAFCPLLSDVHNPLVLKMQLKTKTTEPSLSKEEQIMRDKLWDRRYPDLFVDSIDMLKLCEIESNLDNLIDNNSFDNYNIDIIVQDIANLYIESAQKAFGKQPVKSNKNNYKSKRKPWYGKECDKARKIFNKAKNRFRLSKTLADRSYMKQKGKAYKRLIHKHYRRYVNKNAEQLKNLKSTDPKKFWRLISGKEQSNPKITADAFFDFIAGLNTTINDDEENNQYFDTQDTADTEQLNSAITLQEIKINALKLVNGKSSGLDSVLNEHIKSTLHLMLPIYHKLFNIVFDTGIIPSAWTEGCVIPIYKNKGSNSNPENYRPITLLSCMGKLFTSIINSRLQDFANDYHLLEENQTGFRKNYSTIDNVFSLHVLFELMSRNKQKLYCAFVDFQKAFDTVWRVGLWQKLSNSHVRGKCFTIIYNMYQGIKSCVSVNGKISPFFQCAIGVRQGENLSPFLFSMYLNDLEHYLRTNNVVGIDCTLHTDELFMYFQLFVLLYADDTVIFANSANNLQHALNTFENYCTAWKLTVNIDKTKIMIFGRGKHKNLVVHFGSEPIEIVNIFKYLGVIFSRGGSFSKTIKHNSDQANKAMFLLLRKINPLNLSIDLQIELFDKMIKPILLYGCEVWGYSDITLIERVQLQFLKSIFNLKQSTPNIMIYGEFGVFPIEIDIKTRMINYWIKLIAPNSLKFSNLLYKFLFNMVSNKKSPWLEYIKGILINCGFSGVWDAQKIENPRWLVRSIKQKNKDLYINHWFSNVDASPSCINYRLFKENFALENYMLKLPYACRKIMCLFRTRNHHLPIETGRWSNTDISERKCNLCNISPGDEFHYLMNCKSLASERKRYIKAYYFRQPNIIKFKQLMNVRNLKQLKNLCKFIKITLNACSL